MSLQQESCVPCRKGAPKLSEHEIEANLHDLETQSKGSPWQLSTRTGRESSESSIPALVKTFEFKNFRNALAFTNAVGAMAEQEKHHPEILLEWGRVRVAWWTHAIEGVSITRPWVQGGSLLISLLFSSEAAQKRLHLRKQDGRAGHFSGGAPKVAARRTEAAIASLVIYHQMHASSANCNTVSLKIAAL